MRLLMCFMVLSVLVSGCGGVPLIIGKGNSVEINTGVGIKASARDPYLSSKIDVEDSAKIQ